MAELRSQPLRRVNDILDPLLPCHVREITGAVATAEEIDLKYGPACISKGSCLKSGHSTRFVHLLRKRMNKQDSAAVNIFVRRRMKNTESKSLLERQEKDIYG